MHKISIEELAKQISLIDCELYQEIQLEELYHLNWSKERKHRDAPNVMAVITQFNRISRWVAHTIVNCLKFDLRVNLLRKFIDLAQQLLRLNNFSGSLAILSALSNAAVTRLKKTWEVGNPW